MAQRITTAFFLIVILFFIIFGLPAVFFEITCIAIAFIAAWEWCRISKLNFRLSVIAYVLTFILLILASTSLFEFMVIISVLLIAYALIQVIRYEKIANYRSHLIQLTLVGPLLIATTASSLPKLLYPEIGFIDFGKQPLLMIYVLVIVGMADSGAYFAGKALGSKKLCPKVSPNKTVEGLIGGMLAVAVAALIFAKTSVSLFFGSTIELVITSLLIAVISVAGDLFISVIKRQNKIKDSSQLLPGHGGVLDRIDGLLLAVPAYYFFTLYQLGELEYIYIPHP